MLNFYCSFIQFYMPAVCFQGSGSSSDRSHVWRLPTDDLSWRADASHGGWLGRIHQNQSQTQVRTSESRTLLASSDREFTNDACSLLSTSLKWDNLKKELEGFATMASSCKGGRITIEEFAKFLKLPVNPALEELFALFDRVRDVYE